MDFTFIKNKRIDDCCGCEACSFVCPKQIIQMKEDKEGFVYPIVSDESNCINCGRCEKICPVSNPTKANDYIISYCSGHLQNDEDIRSSASGGLATAISRCFIEKYQGAVYGVAYSRDYKEIRFEKATTLEELEKFRGSKYAQSRKSKTEGDPLSMYHGGEVFHSVITDLKSGMFVLFIGLPCEVAALNNVTKKKFDKLYTIDLVCHGPTSQKVHREYIKNIEESTSSKISSFSVRFKYTGWKPYYIKAEIEGGRSPHLAIFHKTTYGIAFRYLKRPSCAKCRFKLGNSQAGLQADMTIGDFHYVGPTFAAYNKWGSSVGYIHTERGEQLCHLTEDSFEFFDTNPIYALKSSFALKNSVPSKINRRSFSRTFVNKSLGSACSLPSVAIIDAIQENKVLRLLVSIRNYIFKK